MAKGLYDALCGVVLLLFLSVGLSSVHAATLSSIDVTPSDSSIDAGQTQPFIATGTFSDSSTQLLEPAPKAIASGYYNSCTVLLNGDVQCWGGNQTGQLGNGSTTSSITPVAVSSVNTATAVTAGYYSNCALLDDGHVQCWGGNQSGQLGDGTTTERHLPVSVSGISTATQVVMGYKKACALLADGTVKCWGDNQYGQLGDGTTTQSSTPVSVGLSSTATMVATGFGHACALLTDGSVQCWGDNSYGQLGDGTTTEQHSPVTVSGLTNAVAVSAGFHSSCALLASGQVQCWGEDVYGQLGNGMTTQSNVPVYVSGISTATSISIVYRHACARLSSGQLQCWGANQYGQLGDNSVTTRTTPVTVTGISTATAVATGYFHTCALLASGDEQCWGDNKDGQLGNGTSIQAETPVSVTGISTATAISDGDSHSCALTGGSVQCWGYNQFGQLGDGSYTQQIETPVSVTGLSTTATAVDGGGNHTCALLSSGAVQCWGYNQNGQLGIGSTVSYSSPQDVTGLSSGVGAISAGYDFSCAIITSDGSVKCWGDNSSGQLGDNSVSQSTTPVDVSSITNATAIATGYFHSCALLSDGTVQCWGSNSVGQLGNGTTGGYSAIPVAVTGLGSVTAIAAGVYHTCALISGGTVKCWGGNQYGQLGDGTTTDSNVPVSAGSISSAAAVAAGGVSSCVLLTSSGDIQCWGRNNYGQLGDGTTDNASSPVTTGITGATAITVGYYHACALFSGGSEKCWGNNIYGQLGDGDSAISTAPTNVAGAPKVRWSSSDSGVATVDDIGLASAITPGSTMISAVTLDGSVTGSTSLSVNDYSIGGSVSGLTGSMVLKNNGSDSLTVTADGGFTFPAHLGTGSAYDVTVSAQPAGQICAVTNAAGTVASGNVTTVSVTCNAASNYTVGGTVSGLNGTVVLQNNGTDDLSVVTNGSFTFATAMADGAAYDVTVATQPSGQTCTAANAAGAISSADVTGVTVTCSSDSVAPITGGSSGGSGGGGGSSGGSSGGGGGASGPLLFMLLGLSLVIRGTQLKQRQGARPL